MLKSVTLRNFRGFSDHEIPLRELTVVVGRNNAGKSTLVEGLRLLAIITSRFGSLNFHPVPKWLDIGRINRGVSPDLRLADFDFKTVFHRYAEPPACIDAKFESGAGVTVYVGPDSSVHAVVTDTTGAVVPDKARARRVTLPLVAILPQIGPLATDEEELDADYVRRTLDSRLASLHFRNQLRADVGAYRRFREIVETTWPGVRIQELTTESRESASGRAGRRTFFALMVRNDDFVAEASRMGHGLQMWLQTMWFLARTPTTASVILDEPDVYMHPDLQRRLVRLVRGRHRQAILATHSTEIISDVAPESILVVDRSRSRSSFVSAVPEVQQVIDSLGGVQNIHVARLSTARRFLVVEGDDIEVLGPIHKTLFPDSMLPLQDIPSGEAGGWNGWERVIGAADAMRRAFGERIRIYCLFDPDYRPTSAIDDRYVKAKAERIRLHVWGRKELENYLLVPAAIARVLSARVGRSVATATDIAAQIDAIVEDLREETTAAVIDALHALDKAAGAGTAFKTGSRWVEAAWGTRDGRWGVVSGKRVLSQLSGWAKSNGWSSFGVTTVARVLAHDEVPEELRRFLRAVETEAAIDPSWRTDPTSRPAL